MSGTGNAIRIPQELKNFYAELEQIQEKSFTNCRLKLKEAGEFNGQLPLIEVLQPSFESDQLYQTFIEISTLVSKHRPEIMDEIEDIKALPEKLVQDIIQTVLTGDSVNLQDELENRFIKVEIFNTILSKAIQPFLAAFAKETTKLINIESWHQNYCPVCGNLPRLGRMGKQDSKRYLCCSMCDTQWLYKRLVCCHCGNEDHQTLSFLLVEETPGYQIDVCDACKSYLKVIDERITLSPAVIPDIETLYLDLIAQQKGYSNRTVLREK